MDEMIRETLSGTHYAVKWKKAYYGLPDQGWIIEMVAYDVSVNVVFFGGADLDVPPPLGTTDRSRYIKVKTLDELEQPDLRKWVENGVEYQAGHEPRRELSQEEASGAPTQAGRPIFSRMWSRTTRCERVGLKRMTSASSSTRTL